MALTDITLRATSYPPLTTKGSALTYGEMDDNFIEVYAYLVDMNSGGGVPPYSIATGYTGTVWVAYGGKIYRHIGAGTSTGQIPTSYPAVWQEVTSGELTHVQGTDQGLDTGGANAVTAAQLKELVTGQYITTSLASFNTLAGGGNLKPNRIYAITDAVTYGTLLVHTVATGAVAAKAQVAMRVPDPAQLHGGLVWLLGETYTAGDLVAWDSLVYENQTGANGSNTPPNDAVNWQPIDRADPEYIDTTIEVVTTYAGGTFAVTAAHQPAINTDLGGIDMTGATEPQVWVEDDGVYYANTADAISEIGDLGRVQGGLIRYNSLRRSTVQLTKGLKGTFEGNTLTNANLTIQAGGEADITDNDITGATLVWASALVSGDDVTGCSINFPVGTTVNMRSGYGALVNVTASPAGSNAQDGIDITGVTTVNRTANGVCDIYGSVVLLSSNANETIDKIENDALLMPLRIAPNTGLTLTVTAISGSSITNNGEIISGAGGITLNGDRGDYMIVEPVSIGGFDVYQLTEYYTN